MPKYRADIDVLRAIAVLAVVFYHSGFQHALFGVPLFRSGFLGVDIFFVISGYLITYNLITRASLGLPEIRDFYIRRARRILPAFFVVAAVTSVAALHLLDLQKQVEYFKTLAAALVFASNFAFLNENSYWASPSEIKFLLHTWSLAVEEQFYILFPLLLFLVSKYQYTLKTVILTLLGLSFLTSTVLVFYRPEFTFFMLPTRAWEILAGSLVAVLHGQGVNMARPKWIRQSVSVLCLAVLVIWLAFLPASELHPGPLTLPVILATATLIYLTTDNIMIHVARIKSIVFIGLISYSLYLWHWPIFVTEKLLFANEPSALQSAGTIGLAMVLACLSYAFIETPFRNAKTTPIKRFLTTSVAVYTALGVFAFAGLKLTSTSLETAQTSMGARPCKGLAESSHRFCHEFGAGNPEIIVLGDSQAQAFGELKRALKSTPFTVMVLTGCPGLVSAQRFDTLMPLVCDRRNKSNETWDWIKARNYKTFVLVNRHTMYLNGSHQGGKLHQKWHAFVTNSANPKRHATIEERAAESLSALIKALDQTRTYFGTGNNYLILQQVPDHQTLYYSLKNKFEIQRTDINAWHASESKFLTEAEKRQYDVIYTHDYFCNEQSCSRKAKDGTVIYYDDNHITTRGVEPITQEILKRLIKLRTVPASYAY